MTRFLLGSRCFKMTMSPGSKTCRRSAAARSGRPRYSYTMASLRRSRPCSTWCRRESHHASCYSISASSSALAGGDDESAEWSGFARVQSGICLWTSKNGEYPVVDGSILSPAAMAPTCSTHGAPGQAAANFLSRSRRHLLYRSTYPLARGCAANTTCAQMPMSRRYSAKAPSNSFPLSTRTA